MTQENFSWEKVTEEKFQQILKKIPDMIRGIAETRICRKAEAIVQKENRWKIGEKDMVDAFFAETPPAFMGPMKTGMSEVGIDYKKYGYDN